MNIREHVAQSSLADLLEKVEAKERLSFEDGLRLFQSEDLLSIGYLASLVKKRHHGNKVYWVYNRHLNYTNVCLNLCKFCAFGKPKDHPEAYEIGIDEAIKKLKNDPNPIREVHIVGGLHPDLPYQYYLQLIRGVREALPGVQIKAFTCVEINHLAKISGKDIREVLLELKEAGLVCLPGRASRTPGISCK